MAFSHSFIFFFCAAQTITKVLCMKDYLLGELYASNNLTKRNFVSSIFSSPVDKDATYYGAYPGGGACALDPPPPLATQPDWILVAAGEDFFAGSMGCGMCLEITGEGKGSGNNPVLGPIRASVHDRCGCGVDLYIPGDGKWKVEIKAIDCPDVPGQQGRIQFRFTGSNPWSFKLQARNSKVPTKSMEIFGKGQWNMLKRTSDNYFNNNGLGLGEIKFPIKVRVTSIFGEVLETTIPKLVNNEDIPSKIQYKGSGNGGGAGTGAGTGTGAGGAGTGGTGTGGAGQGQPSPGPIPIPPNTGGGSSPVGGGIGGNNGHFCADKDNGMYPDPTDCKYFYKCANGVGERIPCADGLLFNPKTLNCDWAANVRCNGVMDEA